MYIIVYLYIYIFRQISLNERWDIRQTSFNCSFSNSRNIRMISALEVFKTVLDNHFITTRLICIIPRTFRYIHVTSSAKLNLKIFIKYINIAYKIKLIFRLNKCASKIVSIMSSSQNLLI